MPPVQLPPPQIDPSIFRDYVHLPTRCIWLEGEVAMQMAGFTSRAIHIMDLNPKLPITVFLNTEGGDRSAGLAIYDTLRSATSMVRIIGYGVVASAGALILQGGDERLLMPNTQVMIHPGETGLAPHKANEIDIRLRGYTWSYERMYKIIGERLGHTLAEMRQIFPNDHWFDARQAIKLGLADGIY